MNIVLGWLWILAKNILFVAGSVVCGVFFLVLFIILWRSLHTRIWIRKNHNFADENGNFVYDADLCIRRWFVSSHEKKTKKEVKRLIKRLNKLKTPVGAFITSTWSNQVSINRMVEIMNEEAVKNKTGWIFGPVIRGECTTHIPLLSDRVSKFVLASYREQEEAMMRGGKWRREQREAWAAEEALMCCFVGHPQETAPATS